MTTPDAGPLTLTLHGVSYELVADEDVRATDLATHALTVRRRADGEVLTVFASEMQASSTRPRRLPEPRRRWKLRELAERMARLPDDPDWTDQAMRFVTINGLLEVPESVPVGRP